MVFPWSLSDLGLQADLNNTVVLTVSYYSLWESFSYQLKQIFFSGVWETVTHFNSLWLSLVS